MTTKEALSRYPKGQVVVSCGESVRSVCYKIYRTSDDAHLRPFMLLNLRYDLMHLEPGSTLITVPEEILLQIEEL